MQPVPPQEFFDAQERTPPRASTRCDEACRRPVQACSGTIEGRCTVEAIIEHANTRPT